MLKILHIPQKCKPTLYFKTTETRVYLQRNHAESQTSLLHLKHMDTAKENFGGVIKLLYLASGIIILKKERIFQPCADKEQVEQNQPAHNKSNQRTKLH